MRGVAFGLLPIPEPLVSGEKRLTRGDPYEQSNTLRHSSQTEQQS
jgi:hypothetical protein